MITDLKIEGLDDLVRDFAKLGEGAIEKLREPSIEAAERVRYRAWWNINHKSGELGKGLKVVKPSKPKNNKIYARVSFGKNVAYGVPLELGHRLWFMGRKTNKDVPEKPFLRPAADESKEEVADIMARAMNKVLDEWGD